MHNLVVHSNERACRKSGRLGLEQVSNGISLMQVLGVYKDDKKDEERIRR